MKNDNKIARMGKLWWMASNLAEAQEWNSSLTAKGAIVEIKADEENVDVFITLERSRAVEILGYPVADGDWLDESEDDEENPDLRIFSAIETIRDALEARGKYAVLAGGSQNDEREAVALGLVKKILSMDYSSINQALMNEVRDRGLLVQMQGAVGALYDNLSDTGVLDGESKTTSYLAYRLRREEALISGNQETADFWSEKIESLDDDSEKPALTKYGIEVGQIYIAADGSKAGHVVTDVTTYAYCDDVVTTPFTASGMKKPGNRIDTFKLAQVRYSHFPAMELPDWMPPDWKLGQAVVLWPTAHGEVSAFRIFDLANGVGLSVSEFCDECSENEDLLSGSTKNADPFDREFAPRGGDESVALDNLALRYPEHVSSAQDIARLIGRDTPSNRGDAPNSP